MGVSLRIPPPDLLYGENDRTIRVRDRERIDTIYFYHPLTRWFFRRRFRMVLQALGPGPFECVLDAGCGSGFLLPSLYARGKRLVATDLHEGLAMLRQRMVPKGIVFSAVRSDLRQLPFGDASFDAVVCVSVLEHILDVQRAVDELLRVVSPGGRLVIATPVRNWLTGLLFRLLGYDDREIHPTSHAEVLAALHHRVLRVEVSYFPALLSLDNSLYATFGVAVV